MRPTGSPKELEHRRFRAMTLLQDGYPPVEVARMIGVDRRSVRRWSATKTMRGIAALKAKPASGRPARLAASQKQALRKMLLQGASKHGFPTELWTCPRIAQVIRQRFHVRYHVDHLSRLLHVLGFSPQKPERRAIERNATAIRRWVKTEWPTIKKKS